MGNIKIWPESSLDWFVSGQLYHFLYEYLQVFERRNPYRESAIDAFKESASVDVILAGLGNYGSGIAEYLLRSVWNCRGQSSWGFRAFRANTGGSPFSSNIWSDADRNPAGWWADYQHHAGRADIRRRLPDYYRKYRDSQKFEDAGTAI